MAGTAVALAVGTAVAVTVADVTPVQASGTDLHPASYPWNHSGHFQTFDHARWLNLLQ
jgi:hypothetical protein